MAWRSHISLLKYIIAFLYRVLNAWLLLYRDLVARNAVVGKSKTLPKWLFIDLLSVHALRSLSLFGCTSCLSHALLRLSKLSKSFPLECLFSAFKKRCWWIYQPCFLACDVIISLGFACVHGHTLAVTTLCILPCHPYLTCALPSTLETIYIFYLYHISLLLVRTFKLNHSPMFSMFNVFFLDSVFLFIWMLILFYLDILLVSYIYFIYNILFYHSLMNIQISFVNKWNLCPFFVRPIFMIGRLLTLSIVIHAYSMPYFDGKMIQKSST